MENYVSKLISSQGFRALGGFHTMLPYVTALNKEYLEA